MTKFIAAGEHIEVADMQPRTYLVINKVMFKKLKDDPEMVPKEWKHLTLIEAATLPVNIAPVFVSKNRLTQNEIRHRLDKS
jgi:hypothetical protein